MSKRDLIYECLKSKLPNIDNETKGELSIILDIREYGEPKGTNKVILRDKNIRNMEFGVSIDENTTQKDLDKAFWNIADYLIDNTRMGDDKMYVDSIDFSMTEKQEENK